MNSNEGWKVQMTSAKHTLQLCAIICNKALLQEGDHVRVIVDGQCLWSCNKVLFHPHYVYYVDFEERWMHMNGHVESLPSMSLKKHRLSITSLPVILKLQVHLFLDHYETIDRIRVNSTYVDSTIIKQRLKGLTADYWLWYRLKGN